VSGQVGIVGAAVAEGGDAGSGRIEDLYIRHVPTAVRLAALITGNADLAQDIGQDAFLRAVGRFRHLRNAASFEPYLRRAVVNACTSHFRHERIVRAYVRREATMPEPAATSPDVELQDALRTALLELPPRQRAAVVLRFYLDLTEDQAGDALGCSAVAVRSLVTRAMQTLRERIPRSEDA
jgi:RNA polymerase sigma factor (sigma-70 family)